MKLYATKEEILERIDKLIEKCKEGKGNKRMKGLDELLEIKSLIDIWQVKPIDKEQE